MKIKLIGVLVTTAIIIFTYSCKGEKQNQTVANEAEEVKEASSEATTYIVDSASSTIEWTGSKPTGKHSGTLKIAKGNLKIKDEKIEGASFEIDMTSITVTDIEGEEKEDLEKHLKGEGKDLEDHFFNVAQHPKASFEVTEVANKEGKTYIEGNLTIKGIKKNILFPANTSIEGDTMILNTEIFTINRTDWGINYASKSVFTDLGDKFINDDIELKVTVKANKG